MDLSITGEVIKVLEEESGTGRNGVWRKQAFILETPGEYPKQVCVIQWGDNIDKFGVEAGETITAHVDIQSREYNGRWYTDVKAWRIERSSGGRETMSPREEDVPPLPDEPPADLDEGEDLPF
jgi:Domain of unknown function (DUF3127)